MESGLDRFFSPPLESKLRRFNRPRPKGTRRIPSCAASDPKPTVKARPCSAGALGAAPHQICKPDKFGARPVYAARGDLVACRVIFSRFRTFQSFLVEARSPRFRRRRCRNIKGSLFEAVSGSGDGRIVCRPAGAARDEAVGRLCRLSCFPRSRIAFAGGMANGLQRTADALEAQPWAFVAFAPKKALAMRRHDR